MIEQETVRGLLEHATHIRSEAATMLAAYGVKLPPLHDETIQSAGPVVTPRAGVIIKKNVTVGDVVSSTEPMYVVADLSKVWLDLAVYDKQLMSVREGSTAVFTSDSLPGKRFSGRITYFKPATEEGSGTFVARVEMPNPKLLLKPGMIGEVKVEHESATAYPFVPEGALQKYGNDAFVFIDEGHGLYKKQSISLDSHLSDGYLVKAGVSPGDQIVVKGSFMLKAELLKAAAPED
jgi:RND family efflux transporter MFP subunit